MNDKRVIIALDYADLSKARALVDRLDPTHCFLKIGKHMFTRFGPSFVEEVQSRGFQVFLDLKYHDIPNTVADACRAAVDLGVWMVNVHAQGGWAMLEAARNAIDSANTPSKPLLIGVTVLTSLKQEDLLMTDCSSLSLEDKVLRLARMVKAAGLDGVVCSAQEVPKLRRDLGQDFLLVTPGIRLAGDARGDQERVVTPDKALQLGADYLVMGRSITEAQDPIEVLKSCIY